MRMHVCAGEGFYHSAARSFDSGEYACAQDDKGCRYDEAKALGEKATARSPCHESVLSAKEIGKGLEIGGVDIGRGGEGHAGLVPARDVVPLPSRDGDE